MIDFSKIEIKNIEGNSEYVDIRKQLGNYLYYQSTDLIGSELGKKIYFSEGGIELTQEEQKQVLDSAKVLWKNYVMISAINEIFSIQK